MTSLLFAQKSQNAIWKTMVLGGAFYLLLSFGFSEVECLICYAGDWSKSSKMAVVDCEFKYCGIILRQNGSEFSSEANCYSVANLRSRYLKKILLNLSDKRLPQSIAFYMCRANHCNRRSKFIQLKARYKSQRSQSKGQRLIILNVDDDQLKMTMEHRAKNFSRLDRGSTIFGRESNLTVRFKQSFDGSENYYGESTKMEKAAKSGLVKKFRFKTLFSEGRMNSDFEEDFSPSFWKIFQ